MMSSIAERSLVERLGPRMAVEAEFARTNRHSFRKKSLFDEHEDFLVKPWIRLALRLTGLYTRGLLNAVSPVVRRMTVTLPALPPAFDGFELLHISDLHIDGVDGLAEALVGVLTPLEPDLCVLTGDYRFENDGPCDAVYPRMRTVLKSISAEYGVIGILGNHDAAEIAIALEQMGVRMLINDAVELCRGNQSLWVAGVDDSFDYLCDDLPAAFASVPQEACKILLAHTPELYEQAAEFGTDLYLCGHTHAGQVQLPGVGMIRHNAKCPKVYAAGQWRHRQMQGYTTAGAGSSLLPIRYNCASEVALIKLRCGATY